MGQAQRSEAIQSRSPWIATDLHPSQRQPVTLNLIQGLLDKLPLIKGPLGHCETSEAMQPYTVAIKQK